MTRHNKNVHSRQIARYFILSFCLASPFMEAGKAMATTQQPPAPAPATSPPATPENTLVVVPPFPVATREEALAEANRLTIALKHDVHGLLKLPEARRQAMIHMAQEEVSKADFPITRPQILTVVDRNPKVQTLALILALPDDSDWKLLGAVHVSTGTKGRKYYYITPTGVFDNSADRLGYRALGTKNKNGIRGYGIKGMRVWDFGWHTAVKGWLASGETGDIRLEMHATDPQWLEQRLGHTASEGCVRIPATLNVFMDHYGLIDVAYEQAASYDRRFRALLPPDRAPSPIAGSALVVVDSNEAQSAVQPDKLVHNTRNQETTSGI